MKNERTPGTDGITSEIWKDKRLQKSLFKMIQQIWKTEELPTEWNESTIKAIPKKKDFRTMSLINSAAKIYAKVLNNRLKNTVQVF